MSESLWAQAEIRFRSELPARYAQAKFDLVAQETPARQRVLRQVRQWMRQADWRGLALYGEGFVGKTWLAIATAAALIADPAVDDVRAGAFTSLRDLGGSVQSSTARRLMDTSLDDEIGPEDARLSERTVLVIDALAGENWRYPLHPSRERLNFLMEDRVSHGGRLIFTTSQPPDKVEWYLGDATQIDYLRAAVQWVWMGDCEDWNARMRRLGSSESTQATPH